MNVLLTGFIVILTAASLSAQHPSQDRALLDKYCVSCHNSKTKIGGLTLDTADVANVPNKAEMWEKVVKKLRTGAMPPLGMPRPDKASVDQFATWLETSIDKAYVAHPNPGRPALHRLNRAEYANAIRDLLALDIDSATFLPTDDASYGFDNVASVLGLSPALEERYIAAAGKISRLAVGDPATGPIVDTYRVRSDITQDDHIEGLPLGTRGGVLIHHNFPLDGEYVIKVKLLKSTVDLLFGGNAQDETLEIALNG
jgi:cytochrome c551/c552